MSITTLTTHHTTTERVGKGIPVAIAEFPPWTDTETKAGNGNGMKKRQGAETSNGSGTTMENGTGATRAGHITIESVSVPFVRGRGRE